MVEALEELAETKALLDSAEERLRVSERKWSPPSRLLSCLKVGIASTPQQTLTFSERWQCLIPRSRFKGAACRARLSFSALALCAQTAVDRRAMTIKDK